jgi:carboxyl-terminal processing protease
MDVKPKQGKSRIWLRRAVSLIIVLVVFSLGMAVGDGRISFGRGRPANVANSLPTTLDYSSVNKVYRSLRDNFDGKLTETQLTDGLKHGLAASTKDPYTVYFTPKEAKEFNSELNNSFSGIGAQLGQDKDGNLEVIAPIAGLPADKAGLKAHDIITGINGTSTSGMSVDDAVHKIRGPKGTEIKLDVIRDKKTPLNFTVVRADIKIPSVKTKILPNNVGYLQITTFSDDTTELVRKAVSEFKENNVKGIVVDVRSNPGGLLESSVQVASLWLDQGQTVLQEKRGGTVVKTYSAQGGNSLKGIPTVVLVDGGSASASEILTGALRDNNDAYVIGEKSYGKGVVQQLINFADGSQLKVTVASWYRPNGQNINKKGITPDKSIKISDADVKAGTDTQLQAAQDYLNTKMGQ